MIRGAVLAVLACVFLMAAPAQANEASKNSSGMTRVDGGKVKEILRPDLILLENDKRYRIDNVRVPPDYAQEAVDFLKETLLGKTVNVYSLTGNTPVIDRYGLPLTQVMREDGLWVQGEMMLKGIAWFDVSGTAKKVLDALRGMEDDARRAQAGFWSNPAYAVKTPENVGEYLNSFQIVEGKSLYVTKGEMVYVNFGRDYKTDFTINMPRSAWKHFTIADRAAEDFDPTIWEGRRIRIRGWVTEQNGPMIELTDPEQIEFLKQE